MTAKVVVTLGLIGGPVVVAVASRAPATVAPRPAFSLPLAQGDQRKDDPLGGWGRYVETLGVAGLCLVAVGVAIWRVGVFVGNRVLVPLAERHMKFVDEVASSVRALTESQRVASEASRIQAEAARAQTEVQRVQVYQVEAHTKLIQALERNVLEQMEQFRRKLVVHTNEVVISPERKPDGDARGSEPPGGHGEHATNPGGGR